jgi:uncharacterized membrane protein YkgB
MAATSSGVGSLISLITLGVVANPLSPRAAHLGGLFTFTRRTHMWANILTGAITLTLEAYMDLMWWIWIG